MTRALAQAPNLQTEANCPRSLSLTMSLLYLNADIWDHIFSSLTRRDVVALARTDRRINALATDKLYHTITLCNEPRCNMCPKYETLLHPYVKRALRSLELFVGLPFDDRHEEVLCNLLAGASLTRFAVRGTLRARLML